MDNATLECINIKDKTYTKGMIGTLGFVAYHHSFKRIYAVLIMIFTQLIMSILWNYLPSTIYLSLHALIS